MFKSVLIIIITIEKMNDERKRNYLGKIECKTRDKQIIVLQREELLN